jgi:hypothetical protein
MPDGQIVLVTTEPLEGGELLRTIYYVAEEDATNAEAIIAEVMAPNPFGGRAKANARAL